MADLDLKLKVEADNADAQDKFKQTSAEVEDVGVKTEKTNSIFYTFVTAATLGMVGLAKSIIGAANSLYSFAQTTLGLNVKLETSNLGLKAAGFLVQNLRKEFTISLGFLKNFADYPEFRFDVDNGITLCEPCHKKQHEQTGPFDLGVLHPTSVYV